MPNKKLVNPIFAIAGTPFANIKMQIRITAAIETHAVRRKIIFIVLSETVLVALFKIDLRIFLLCP